MGTRVADRNKTEHKSGRGKAGKIAAATAAVGVGAVLLMNGGASLAGWEKTVTGDGVTVSSGTLDLKQSKTIAWTDVSPDLTEASINPETYLIVPGDHVRGVQDFTVDLKGNNLKADLTAGITGMTGSLVDEGLTGTVTLLDKDGATLATKSLNESSSVVLAQLDNTNSENAKYTVQLDLTYDADASGGEGGNAALAGIDLTLAQVR